MTGLIWNIYAAALLLTKGSKNSICHVCKPHKRASHRAHRSRAVAIEFYKLPVHKPGDYHEPDKKGWWQIAATPTNKEEWQPILVKSMPIKHHGRGTARNVVADYLQSWPENWDCATVEWSCGCTQQTFKLSQVGRFTNHTRQKLIACLSNSNSYSAPNFNIDTSTNIAGLTALKLGVPPAVGDRAYTYNDATLTAEQSFAMLQWILGQTSAGAAGAGLRVGHVVFNAGITVTWDGNASYWLSGVSSNPTSADASSKGCTCTVNGVSGNPVTMTNSAGALNASNQWTILVTYGNVVSDYNDTYYTYNHVYTTLSPFTSYANTGFSITNNNFYGINASGYLLLTNAGTWGYDCTYAFNTNHPAVGASNIWHNMNSGVIPAGVNFNFSGNSSIPTGTTGNTIQYMNINKTYYSSKIVISGDDVRPNRTVPTSPAATDPASGGTLEITIANIASYADADMLTVTDNGTGLELLRRTKAQYVADGNKLILRGLTNATLYTLKMRATSDGYNWSGYSVTFTGTPTSAAAPSKPTEISVAEGDAQLTATFKGQTGKYYYMRVWDASNGMSVQSNTFRVLGNGATPVSIVYTGLTNFKPYIIFVYGLDGSYASDWVSDGVAHVPSPAGELNYETIGNVIRTRFKTYIEDSIGGGLPTQYDNTTTFSRPENGRWARITVKEGEQRQVSIGSTKRYRKIGILTVQVFTPIGQGDKDARVVADYIAERFRCVDDADVHFNTPHMEVIGRTEKWWQVNVTCPFYADDIA